ncbi:unnamed protein product [Tenebrio molitor]|nr:unnamed protein product [Tenebrio molitor]
MTEAERLIASCTEQITAHWMISYESLCKSLLALYIQINTYTYLHIMYYVK